MAWVYLVSDWKFDLLKGTGEGPTSGHSLIAPGRERRRRASGLQAPAGTAQLQRLAACLAPVGSFLVVGLFNTMFTKTQAGSAWLLPVVLVTHWSERDFKSRRAAF